MTAFQEALDARDAAEARAAAAEARVQVLERLERARDVIASSANRCGTTLNRLEVRGLLVDLPLTESGALDEAALESTVLKAATGTLELNGG